MITQLIFNQWDKVDKVALIKKAAPHIIKFAGPKLLGADSQLLNQLLPLINLEQHAQQVTKNTEQELNIFSKYASSCLNDWLKPLKLSSTEHDLVNNLYKKTVIVAVNQAAKRLQVNIAEPGTVLYSVCLSQATVDILSGILSFKQQLDKYLPVSADKILGVASAGLTHLLAVNCPPLGVALKATNMLGMVSNLLSNDSLQKTINNMQADLAQIKQDKILNDSLTKAVTIADISEKLVVPITAVAKLNQDKQQLTQLVSLATDNSAAATSLMQNICTYIEQHTASNRSEAQDKFENFQQAITATLNQQQFFASNNQYQQILKSGLEQIEQLMLSAGSANNSLGTKISSNIQADHIAQKTIKQIVKQIPVNESGDTAVLTKQLEGIVQQHLRGNLPIIAAELRQAPINLQKNAQELLQMNVAQKTLLNSIDARKPDLQR